MMVRGMRVESVMVKDWLSSLMEMCMMDTMSMESEMGR